MNISTIKAFTIVELIVVIAIISLLASISIPIYMKYQNKAKVTSYALPMVKACAYDAAGLCQEINISSSTTLSLNGLKNCESTIVPGGSLTINISGSVTCDSSGYVSDGTISGKLDSIEEYKASCYLNAKGIECSVK
jgi:prepilin-type N-terminal cleavage/methylation domain-containing protein